MSHNPLYRTYLEHTWLWLNPGETRRVQVMFEYAYGSVQDKHNPPNGNDLEQYQRVPNDVGLVSFIEDPTDSPRHELRLHGGAQAQVVTGRATDIQRVEINGEAIQGTVITIDDGKVVPDGKVIVILWLGEAATPIYREVRLSEGRFAAGLPNGWSAVQLYFVPPPGYADSTSVRFVR